MDVACPTSPTTAFKIGEGRRSLSMYLADVFTLSLNLAGNCGLNLPCGSGAAGKPAHYCNSARAAAGNHPCAHAYEQATGLAFCSGQCSIMYRPIDTLHPYSFSASSECDFE